MPDISASVDEVRRQIETNGWRRIGIDGVQGAGKSDIAEELAATLAIPALDLDDYLHRQQGGYVDFIDYPALRTAIRSMPAFILHGVCLRQVLSTIDTDLDGQVYVMRMRDGVWADEEECVFPEGVDAAIDSLADRAATISRYLDEPTEQVVTERDDDALQLTFEIMRYHAEYLPQETADLVYERGEREG